ncbi:hypothetical protein [Aureimonas jatrophae]|uniref:SnoaL-like domain-containing protein n=1 Tax=Aureimonas jatrophae TaxID=1166073 RepID=A0A1H0C936_9HYPH|nr:hypothetical protein [Aureimonas jatrophae]SDN54369.1 hypothetical protein SAMN05192530_101192 [Aureimonas jatrophae]
MRDPFANPFSSADADRHAIWQMLVERDIDAFLAGDWAAVSGDFVDAEFSAIDARRLPDPADWRLAFPTLDAYRREWLRQAQGFSRLRFAEDPRDAIFRTTRLEAVQIDGDRALARKCFDGGIRLADGSFDAMNWQTLYQCRRTGDGWRITGFVGYLPYPMPKG